MRFRLMPPVLLLISLAALSGCGGGPDQQHGFETYVENGTETARTTGGPKYQQELFDYRRTREIRSPEETQEGLLERPLHMLIAPSGDLYVADRGRRQVLAFSADGEFLRAFGRPGNGPGEFSALSLLEANQDRIAVYDPALGRTSLFKPSGELIDVVTLPPNMPRGYSMTAVVQMHVLPSGRQLAIERSLQQGTHTQFSATMMTADSDTLWTIQTPSLRTSYETPAMEGFSAMIRPIEFGSQPDIVFEQAVGTVISPGDRPVLEVYSHDGERARRIEIVMEPEPVSAKDRQQVLDRHDERIAQADERMLPFLRAQKEALVFAETMPAWTSVRIDDFGYFWLGYLLPREEGPGAPGMMFRVLDPQGMYLGDTQWPTRYANAQLSRGYLAVIEPDTTTSEPILVLYEIQSAIPGFTYP